MTISAICFVLNFVPISCRFWRKHMSITVSVSEIPVIAIFVRHRADCKYRAMKHIGRQCKRSLPKTWSS
jgi:hypothetical protein